MSYTICMNRGRKITKAASYARLNGTLFVATNEDTHLPVSGDICVPGKIYL
jgi:hypothetical protein